MKKSIVVLALILILFVTGSASATITYATPLEVGETLDINGLFSFQVVSYGFVNEFKYYDESDDSFSLKNHGKDTHQFMQIEIDILNTSFSEINIQKYLKGYVLYSKKYPFEGMFYQRDLNRYENICYFNLPIGVLEESRVVFMFEAPNILETSNDSLDFYITLDGNEYVVNLR